ncbi:MAG: peptidoglycan recognition protein family protein [Bacteroidetes bacterium]|nr:peptidoglycan recognition protein family protein [Bacteroidota bacterium]MBU1116008.1 peptidoglycan recognition protein family protein [Bacteroidota bacterium]MBU1799224.1 peptidoglycan recognition protein family protein [Bacteroidota bacterium]
MFILFQVASFAQDEQKINIMELNYPEELSVITRSDWGWLPLENSKEEAKITKITIHHGGVEVSADKDPIESIRNLQKWSRVEKKWIDIPYHFMIDLEGKIYEARPINLPGDTNTEYDPTGHALIEVMGNYEIQEFSENQMKSLVALSVFLAKEFNVPVSDIKTHKDYSATTVCPGKNIYKYFEDGTFIKMIEAKVED